MHGPFVFPIVRFVLVLCFGRWRLRLLHGLRRDRGSFDGRLFDGGFFGECIRQRRFFVRARLDDWFLLAARRRHARLFVLVIRVTRHAARLLHLVINHGNNRVIGDAAFTRTIVVQNVTEPKPALLH